MNPVTCGTEKLVPDENVGISFPLTIPRVCMGFSTSPPGALNASLAPQLLYAAGSPFRVLDPIDITPIQFAGK